MSTTASFGSQRRVEVVRAGASTTVQDLGRSGFLHCGVPGGGAMDRCAARLANLLVGNDEGAALLETTMAGPVLKFAQATVVAVAGAEFAGVPGLRPMVIAAGETLSLAELAAGCRGYVAFGGGVSVAPVMGSASTYARAGLGGYAGRVLRAGDVVLLGEAAAGAAVANGHWRVSSSLLPKYAAEPVVRVVRGPQWAWFSAEAQGLFFNAEFVLSPVSDRMGLRLEGAAPGLAASREMVSEAVAFGSVQVPPDGKPIVLMADRQTIGGYPKIANVIGVDLPLLAQVRPGARVRFAEVSVAEAQALFLAEERALARLREGLKLK